MKEKIIFILIIIVFLGGAFYWFQWRPSKIYSYCNNWALDRSREKCNCGGKYQSQDYDVYYKRCLREKGLEK
jgi:hypothetical protein